jgi:tetratricopeptide (TPR) repeat protein
LTVEFPAGQVRLCRREASVVVGAALCQRFGGRDPVLGPAIASFVGSFLTLVFTEVANVFWMLDLPHVRQQLFEVVLSRRYSSRGAVWNAIGDQDKAMQDFDQAVRLDPQDLIAHTDRGRIWLERGDTERAMADLNQAIQIDPKDAISYGERARVRHAMGDFVEAMADFERAIGVDPTMPELYAGRAYVLHAMGDHERAISDFDTAINSGVRNKDLLNGRGLAFIGVGRLDAAINDFDEAIRLCPNDPVAFNNRGFVLHKQGKYESAITNYETAIQLDPNHPSAYKNWGWLLATCEDAQYRNGEKAVALTTKAMELSGWAVANWFEILAAAFAEAGRFDEAVRGGEGVVMQAELSSIAL